MMRIYSIFIFVITLIYHLNNSFAQYSITGTQVVVRPRPDGQYRTDIFSRNDSITTFTSNLPIDLYYTSKTTTPKSPMYLILTYSFPLTNSDCFCSYDRIKNLLSCSPLLRNSFSFPISSTNISILNITLTNCTFSNNHLNLPMIKEKNIDYLRLYNINHQDYLVFDATTFSSYTINNLYIFYSYIQPITMLLISQEIFSSLPISLSLRTLYIDSCYLITLNKPFSKLFVLESITLKNIDQFSWYDFQQEIISLPKLRYVYIEQDINLLSRDIFNAISCHDISSQWLFTFHLIQTCSCKFISFLKTIQYFQNISKCPNLNNPIYFIHDICQFNGTIYKIQNQTNLFCNKCLTYKCSNGTLCAETFDLNPNCLLLSRYDYDFIRQRIPLTSYTKQFLLQESQQYLSINPNKTLEPTTFYSVATILINSNQNHTSNSANDAQMFHQTFSEMLNRPWSPSIYSATTGSSVMLHDLIISLDDIVNNINDNETIFEFQSNSISTMSLRFPTEQQLQYLFGWEITNNNTITANITNSQLIQDENITTRVFLTFNNSELYQPTCNTSNPTSNCTNRFSVTSIKSQKLFYSTDRIPEYDVISIVAPSSKQHVIFHFEQKFISNNTLNNSISNSFYDQLDLMIPEGTCMYLNTTSMIWQTDGCLTDRKLSNSSSVICTCEHLTMFTVFFSLSCEQPSKALDILSWIGCCLSIIGLSITLIVFIVISQCQRIKNSNYGISSSHSSSSQELRRRITGKPRRLSMVKSMLFVLCILLILMNILIFILTFIKAGRNLTCTILSSLLYYFTLTAFIWKLLFAFQQSLFITNIFQQIWSDRTLFIIYLILTFSLPLCPLLIIFIKYENSTFISSTCNYCWLTREFLLYGLIIPILVIVCLNIIFYFYTMIHLCIKNRQQPGLRSTKSDHSRSMQNFKIGLFFSIIMGLSWILGFLLLIPNSYIQLVGNILFCIVNSLQGFAFSIMVFCMLERKSFRKCCCFWRYKNSIKTTLNSPSIILQPSAPISNDDKNKNNNPKIKTVYNTSIYTSSTSDNDNINHQEKNKLSIEKENIYSTLTF